MVCAVAEWDPSRSACPKTTNGAPLCSLYDRRGMYDGGEVTRGPSQGGQGGEEPQPWDVDGATRTVAGRRHGETEGDRAATLPTPPGVRYSQPGRYQLWNWDNFWTDRLVYRSWGGKQTTLLTATSGSPFRKDDLIWIPKLNQTLELLLFLHFTVKLDEFFFCDDIDELKEPKILKRNVRWLSYEFTNACLESYNCLTKKRKGTRYNQCNFRDVPSYIVEQN